MKLLEMITFLTIMCDTEHLKIVLNSGTHILHKAINMCDSFNDMESDRKYFENVWKEGIIKPHKENVDA